MKYCILNRLIFLHKLIDINYIKTYQSKSINNLLVRAKNEKELYF